MSPTKAQGHPSTNKTHAKRRGAKRRVARRKLTRKIQQSGNQTFPELGEGRSTSIYLEPACKDVAVLLVFYNPAGFKRILNNILYIMHIMKEKKIPVFVAECVFNNAKPEIPGANLVVHSNSYMFYKEQLMNKLEKIVPAKYTKLVLLDGDIIFDSPDWIDQVSLSLNKYDIIQPYTKACWLMPGNKIIRSWKYSYAYAFSKKIAVDLDNLHVYHPGFAWALKRKTFQDLGGLYPNAIIGGGDMLFTFNFFQSSVPESWLKGPLETRIAIEAWPEYHANFKRVAPTVGAVDIRALHLFHGLTVNRQYKTRYVKFAHLLDKKWDDHITYNDDGITEFKEPALRTILLSYFKERDEDIPLADALKLSQTVRRSRRAPAIQLNLNQEAPANTQPL